MKINTTLEPIQLLDTLQAIENDHGRVRSVRWGPRTLDLDILLYDNQVIETERLTVPHYQMHLRNFVLYPLYDISPDLILPDQTPLKQLIHQHSQDGLEIIANTYPWL